MMYSFLLATNQDRLVHVSNEAVLLWSAIFDRVSAPVDL